jgi:hypothetical protein
MKNSQIFGAAAHRGLTIDEINQLPHNRDDRSIQEKAKADHIASLKSQYEGALQHVETLKRTPSAAASGPAMRIAERNLAEARARCEAAGVAV